MPFPSRGCLTCRDRRVKCDEARPVCAQCKKAARVCTGFYSDPGNLPFRSENTFAGGASRRPRKTTANNSSATSRKSSPRSDAGRKPPHDGARARKGITMKIPKSPGLAIEIKAMNNYMASWLDTSLPANDNIHTFVKGCVDRIGFSNLDSSLGLALSAASLAVFGRSMAAPAAFPIAHQNYVKALRQTMTAVGDPNEATGDNILLAVMFLGTYERAVCDYEKQCLVSESYRHHDGAATILKLRKTQNRSTNSFRPLDKYVRQQLIRQAVLGAQFVRPWLRDGAEYGEEGIELKLDACLVRLGDLRNNLLIFRRNLTLLSVENRRLELRNILTEAQEIENQIVDWAISLPSEWTYTTTTITRPRGSDETMFYNDSVCWYGNLDQATGWNRYRAARIVTNGIIVGVCNHLGTSVETESPEGSPAAEVMKKQQGIARSNIRCLVDDVCASVPFTLGRLRREVLQDNIERPAIDVAKISVKREPGNITARRAFLLAWPLVICAPMMCLPQQQRLWIQSLLIFVSRTTGNRVLQVYAEDVEFYAFPNATFKPT